MIDFRSFVSRYRTDIAFVVGILAIALAFRLFLLDEYPRGLFADEASKGPFALDILLRNARPIFNESQSGREPLLIYLEAISIGLFGSTATAMRIPAVIAGVLTVLGLYLLVSEAMIAAPPGQPRRPAFAAALLLAILYSHVSFSRSAFRGALLPLFVVFFLYWLSRAWRTNHRTSFVWAGLCLGGSLYTYTAARFLPFVFLAFLFHQGLCARPRLRRGLPGLFALSVAASLVAGPLAIYFIQNPFAFGTRASETSIATLVPDMGGIGPALWYNISRTLTMFGQQGDFNWHYNLPGLPILDPWLYPAFILGLGVCVWRWKSWEYAVGPLTVAVMALPSILSNEAPHALRNIGTLPAVALITGLGISAAWGASLKALGGRLAAIVPVGVFLLFTATATSTGYHYFVSWPASVEEHGAVPWEKLAIADYVNGSGTDVYLDQSLFAEADVIVYLTGSRYPQRASIFRNPRVENAQWRSERVAVVLPRSKGTNGSFLIMSPPSRPAERGWIYVLPPLQATVAKAFPQWLMEHAESVPIFDRLGVWRATAYLVERAALPFVYSAVPQREVRANLGDAVDLIGYDLPEPRLELDEPLEFTLYWRARVKMDLDYDVSIQVQDLKGNGWAQEDRPVLRGSFPTSQWLPGEVVPEGIEISLPKDAPPGVYRVMIGLERIWNRTLLEVFDDNHREAPSIFLGPLRMVKTSLQPTSLPPRLASGAIFADQITLVGYDLSPGEPGGVLALDLHWQALRRPDLDYTVFVHLLDSQGRIVAQSDAQPGAGNLPTSTWATAETVVDRMTLPLSDSLGPGDYRLAIGLYDLDSRQRLTVTVPVSTGVSVDYFPLTDVTFK
jgi:4-amino-4-deoxy-L-arabinose transferase-like glycosyltransferase